MMNLKKSTLTMDLKKSVVFRLSGAEKLQLWQLAEIAKDSEVAADSLATEGTDEWAYQFVLNAHRSIQSLNDISG